MYVYIYIYICISKNFPVTEEILKESYFTVLPYNQKLEIYKTLLLKNRALFLGLRTKI